MQAAGHGRARRVVARGRDDHVVRGQVHVGQVLPVELCVGQHRGQVLGRHRAARGGELGEVVEEVEQYRELLLQVGRTPQLLVVAAEELLGQHEHAVEVALGQAEEREDHVERVVHRDVAHEVAFGAQLGHAVDEADRQLLHAVLHALESVGLEPSRRDGPVRLVIRLVHVDERAQHLPLLDGQRLGGLARQKGPRRAQEERVVPFHLHHVGVTRDRPEGAVARLVDPMHRRLPAQEGGGLVEALFVCVSRGVDEDPARLADAQPRRARHAAPDLVVPLRSIP